MTLPDTRMGGGTPFKLFKPYASRVAGLLCLIVIAALGEAVGLVFLSTLLNVVLSSGGGAKPASALASVYNYAADSPRGFLLLLGIVYIGKTLLALWGNFASFSLALRMTDDWRTRLIAGYLQVPLRRLDKPQGAMVQMVLDEPTAVGLGLGSAGLLAQNALSVLTIYVVLLFLSPIVTLGLTVMAGAAMMTVGLLSRYSRRISVERSFAFSNGYAYLTEMLGAIKQLRIFNLEERVRSQAGRHLEIMRNLQWRANAAASSPRLLIEVVFLLGLLAVFVALMPRLGEAAVLSTLGLAVAAAMRLLPSLSAVAGTWVLVQHAWPAMVRIADEMSRLERTASEEASSSGHQTVTFRDRLQVEGVTFSYPDRGNVLASVNLQFPYGTFTGIVGPSGSGKSTLVDLLCGCYIPEGGGIVVDGVDLRQVSLAQWRQQIGVVAQDGFLMSGTLRDNLCLLRPDCPDDLLQETVTLVGAEGFIRSLPDGYETRIGERGLALSGGQRQRLALARVLIKEPRVLILDEATSALDVESEEALQEGLERLRGRLTMIVIAHRLSTVRRADQIYVFERGRVVEVGGHESLLREGGLYASMHRTAELGLVGL